MEPEEVILDDVDSVDDEKVEKVETKFTDINYSNVNKIPKEEKQKMIKDMISGIEYKHFELKESANGYSIKRKTVPTKTQRMLNNTKSIRKTPDPDKTYLSENGQLWEHVIELTKQNVLKTEKNKKRKRENIQLQKKINKLVDELSYYMDEDDIQDDNKPIVPEQTTISSTPKPRPKTLRERLINV